MLPAIFFCNLVKMKFCKTEVSRCFQPVLNRGAHCNTHIQLKNKKGIENLLRAFGWPGVHFSIWRGSHRGSGCTSWGGGQGVTSRPRLRAAPAEQPMERDALPIDRAATAVQRRRLMCDSCLALFRPATPLRFPRLLCWRARRTLLCGG